VGDVGAVGVLGEVAACAGAQGVEDRLSWLVRAYFVSYMVGQVLPTSIGGDASRIYETTRRHAGVGGAAAGTVLLERALGAAATLVLAAAGFALAVGRYDVGGYLWVELAFVVVTATDLERRIVPNRVVLPAAAAVLALQTASHPSPEWALGALGAAGFLLLAALAYPGGMGMGDVKLALLIGALLGRTTPVGIMLGLLLALVPSVVLLARHGARARRLAIPFAPFLAAGAVVALFAGNHILHAYLGVLK